MRPKARFIRSVVSAAQDCDAVMPWARSVRRARRNGLAPLRQVRTA